MNKFSIAGLLVGLTFAVPHAHAQVAQLRGSDTLFDVVGDSINQSGLQTELQYLGGGSGLGETGLRTGTQGIAPMSRALNNAAIIDLQNQGVTPVQHVIGLDGVSLFVRSTNTTLTRIDIPTLRSIYTCQITNWSNVPNSGGKTGVINAFRRNDASGTTDTFKTLVGITTFGACVTVVNTTQDISTATATDANAIGYAGLSGEVAGNKPLAVSRTLTSTAVAPTAATIRAFSYPLARRLFLNTVADGRFPSDAEQALLDVMLDRSFLDPILTAREFITCPPVSAGGCP
ncbi:MAG: substrate-binding domain-containing protein [Myxococcales bacterium]|nr:substrate-binding domain-containing protein [Myxococcales bacterium]